MGPLSEITADRHPKQSGEDYYCEPNFVYFQNMDEEKRSFKKKLGDQHQFPDAYLLKFIVPVGAKQEVLNLLPQGKITFRESGKGNYVSISLEAPVQSGEEVLEVYQNMSKVKGIISL